MRHILHVSHMIHVIHIIHRIHAYIIYFSRMHESVRACVFILVILVTPLLRDTCCWRSCSGCITVVSTTLLHVTPYHESTVYNNNNITNNLSSNSNIVIIMLTSRFFQWGDNTTIPRTVQYMNACSARSVTIRAPDNNSSPATPFLPILFRFTFQERSQIFFWLGHPEPNAHQIQQIRNEKDSIHRLWLNTYSNPHPPNKKMNGKHIWGWAIKVALTWYIISVFSRERQASYTSLPDATFTLCQACHSSLPL